MKFFRTALLISLLGLVVPLARAAGDRISTHFSSAEVVEAPNFEVSSETAYLVGIIGNPNSYEVPAQFFAAQGPDFPSNILTAVGVSYKVTDRWKWNAGVLYQHLSNAAQTDPNPSVNLLGPQLGVTYVF